MDKKSALSRVREQKGFTQRQLAEMVGVDPQTVGSWERGSRVPRVEVRARLSEVLDTSLEDLGLQVPKNQAIQEKTPENPGLFSPTALVEDFDASRGIAEISLAVAPDGYPNESSRRREQTSSLAVVSHDRNVGRERMLGRFQSRWISGVLDHYPLKLISLQMAFYLDAVASPWLTEPRESSSAQERTLSDGTNVIDVFDRAGGELLILGDGGAGKSTLLLELGRDLVTRARRDDDQPLPVIFHLLSWEQQQLPFSQWLAEELNTKYQIPQKLAYYWVQHDQILPLLDGLDEVSLSTRTVCIEAINRYRNDHGMVPMVVCSRTTEYLSQKARLILSSAISVLPLSVQQIETYLTQSKELTAMSVAFKQVAALRELCSTPLMLSILTVNYSDMTVEEVLTLQDKQRFEKFEDYINKLLKRRPSAFADHDIMRWLGWLAWQMKQHGQTEFYVESLQPDWLPKQLIQRYRSTIIRIIYGIESIVVAGLFAWLRGGTITGPRQENVLGVGAGIFGLLGGGPGDTIFGWMAPGLGGGLEAGASLGIFMALLLMIVTLLAGDTSMLSWKTGWRGFLIGGRSALLFGIPIALVGMPFFFLTAYKASLILDVIHALSFGGSIGIFDGLILGLLSGLLASVRGHSRNKTQGENIRRTWKQKFGDTIIFGCLGSGIFGLVDIALHVHASTTITFTGIGVGLSFGLGGGTALIPDVATIIRPAEIVSWSFTYAKRGLEQNIVKGVTLGGILMLCVMFVIGLGSGLFNGFGYGLHYGLVYGLIIGLVASVTVFLTAALNGGWSSRMLSERHYSRTNEGIKRSLRHGLIAGGLFGIIGGLASGLVAGGAFGLVGGLPDWIVLGVGFAITFGLIFALEFGLLHGLIAAIEHYVLRWYLYRADIMPLHLVRFLDDAAAHLLLRKIGGSYMFTHRDFLEYFAQSYEVSKMRRDG